MLLEREREKERERERGRENQLYHVTGRTCGWDNLFLLMTNLQPLMTLTQGHAATHPQHAKLFNPQINTATWTEQRQKILHAIQIKLGTRHLMQEGWPT